MNKRIFITLPIVVTFTAISLFLLFGIEGNRNEFLEVPSLFTAVILMILKVTKYNKKIKMEHQVNTGAKKIHDFQDEHQAYKVSQKTLTYLVIQMLILYAITFLAIMLFL